MLVLPLEIIDIIFRFTNDFSLIKDFWKYMSKNTISLLIKDIDIYTFVSKSETENLKILISLLYHNSEKLLRCCVLSRNLTNFKVCYNRYKDVFVEKNIINSIVKRDLVEFIDFLYHQGELVQIDKLFEYSINWHAVKIVKFLSSVYENLHRPTVDISLRKKIRRYFQNHGIKKRLII